MKRIKLDKHIKFSGITMEYAGDQDLNELVFDVEDKYFETVSKLCKAKGIKVEEVKEPKKAKEDKVEVVKE